MDMGSVDMPAMFLQAFGSTRYPSPSNDEYENRSGSNEGFVLDSFGSNIDLGLLAKSSPVVVGPASSSAPPPPPLAAVNVDRVAPLPFAPTLDIRLRAPSPKLEGEETLMHSTTQDLPPPFVTATTTTLPPPSPRRVPLASPLRRSLNRRVEERGEVPPDTPVSAMSGSSIFSVGAVFDRPCPFTISRRGSHINLIDNPAPAPPAAAPPPPSPTQSVKAPSDVESRDQGICDTDATEARVNMTSSSATAPPPPLPLPLPLPTPQFTPAAVQAGAICLESWRQRGHDEWVEALRTGLDGQTLGPDLYAPLSIGGHSRSSSLVSEELRLGLSLV